MTAEVLPALPADAAVLDAMSDPGQMVVAMLDRAKSWLAQAQTTDLPEVVDAKAKAEAIRVYTVQKELGHDAELSAAEIVRRAERRIGELIREGQAEGTVLRRGEKADLRNSKISPTKVFGGNGSDAFNTYAVTDGVSSEEFEEGLAEAKAEGNLSRANVVRKVKQKSGKQTTTDRIDEATRRHPVAARVQQFRDLAAVGWSSRQIAEHTGVTATYVRRTCREHGIPLADAVIGKTRTLNSNRIVNETVHALDGLATGVDLVDFDHLDADQIEGWATSLSHSLRVLNRFNKRLKEIAP